MPEENYLPAYVCGDLRMPFQESWPQFKHYD
jgi:hypothetical protein